MIAILDCKASDGGGHLLQDGSEIICVGENLVAGRYTVPLGTFSKTHGEYQNQLLVLSNDRRDSPIAAVILSTTQDTADPNGNVDARLRFVTRSHDGDDWRKYSRGPEHHSFVEAITKLVGFVPRDDLPTVLDVPGVKDKVFMKGGEFDSEVDRLATQFKLGKRCVEDLHEAVQLMHEAVQRNDGRLTADDIATNPVLCRNAGRGL